MVSGVTAVILAGGNSTRMKSNKALLPYRGERFIERIYRQLADIFPEVILVTNTPEMYRFLPCRKVSDHFPGMGSLAGIHAGLSHSTTPHIFVVACDMPDLNDTLIRQLVAKADGNDVVIPESEGGMEPLHAVYGKGCLPAMEKTLSSGKRRIVECFEQLKQSCRRTISCIDPAFLLSAILIHRRNTSASGRKHRKPGRTWNPVNRLNRYDFANQIDVIDSHSELHIGINHNP
jgi:molybdopterin-guanine dinucleotide biosynthesis protein A